MSDLLKNAIKRAELALADLKRVEADPKDETALISAYGELDSALRDTRRLFPELGFEPIEPRIEAGEVESDDAENYGEDPAVEAEAALTFAARSSNI